MQTTKNLTKEKVPANVDKYVCVYFKVKKKLVTFE